MNKPTGVSEGTATNFSDQASHSLERWNQGSMGGRQVSGPAAETAATRLRKRRQSVDIARAADPNPGLRSRRAVVATPRKRWRPPALQGVHASLVRPFPGIRGGRQASIEPGPSEGAGSAPPGAEPAPDFLETFRTMRELRTCYRRLCVAEVADEINKAIDRAGKRAVHKLNKRNGDPTGVPTSTTSNTLPERAYCRLREMARRAELGGDETTASLIRGDLRSIDLYALEELRVLSRKHGFAETPEQRATAGHPPAAEPRAGATPGVTPTDLLPWLDHAQQWLCQHFKPLPDESPTVREVLWAPPGPSSRVMAVLSAPALPGSAGTPPAWKTPQAPGMARAASGSEDTGSIQRMPIVRRLMEHGAVQDAVESLRTGGAGALGWTAAQCHLAIQDISRLHEAARSDPAAATTLAEVDWDAIDRLIPILDVPPPSP